MNRSTGHKRKYRIVFCKGSTLTKIALLAVIVLSMVALFAIGGAINRKQNQLDAQKKAALAEALEQEELQKDIDALGSADSIADIAGEELGMVPGDSAVVEKDD